jgi:nitroimidazol reductase NimA-like FMN-containing flavoprotein (pyridoxamine 5'-phosphate oxidase superfamily)
MTPLPTDDPVVADLLAGPNLARIAYIGLDGRPRVVPIWFQQVVGEIRMITGPKAEKAKALAANPAVALTIDSSTPPYKVLLVQGDAVLEHIEGMAPEYPDIVRRYLAPATEAYIGQLHVKRQVRIRVSPTSTRVFDFVRRYPQSLR